MMGNIEYGGNTIVDTSLFKPTNVCHKIDRMTYTLQDISRIYKVIDVQPSDIILTMADTGEKYSVNQLVSIYRATRN